LARRFELGGWVKNGGDGVEIYVEGATSALDAFGAALLAETPPAARIATAQTRAAACAGLATFEIRQSEARERPTVRIAPDLPVCDACLHELFDPANRRYRYPYINCTDCGPRYSIVRGLPYDRSLTTMADWALCDACAAEYADPLDRRFHAQPVACPACGPTYVFEDKSAAAARGWDTIVRAERGWDAIVHAAERLRAGAIVALKGVGGYHLACDPANATAVSALRERKFRRERPFALMARDIETARRLIVTDAAVEALLGSSARPIVLAEARVRFDGVAPENRELGVMLPYAPLHHLLFAAGAPATLVVTSANRSNEPLAYEDDEARASLAAIADAFLIGERAIARRLDDSVARVATGSPAILRRGRGYAPAAVAAIPAARPILALGGDLKNALVLVVEGVVFASQHVGDLEQRSAYDAFEATARDLCAMYDLRLEDVLVVHDAHPEYVSTLFARGLNSGISPATETQTKSETEFAPEPKALAVQHHRAHVASVVAERQAWTTDVVGVAFDGTGYGDDGTIWGGEFFFGSVARGFERTAHLRSARLPGGDAAARFPVQAAAGFLFEIDGLPDLALPPFSLGARYAAARELVARDVRCFATSSIGRLFDAVAALLGFTGDSSFEGQAAMWLEHLAWSAAGAAPASLARSNGGAWRSETAAPGPAAYSFPIVATELDFRPLLRAIVEDRARGRAPSEIALGFHLAVTDAIDAVAASHVTCPVACSGGVFQNALLAVLVRERLGARAWFNAAVPPNDGGLALGQAALAAFRRQ
jgi:hydrogenase maturation protein HypF